MMNVRVLFQLMLFMIIWLPYSTGIDIQEVNLVNEIKSPYTASGAVYVEFGDTWGYVCYHGDKKNWGKREATTACKQLGYQGGWPTKRDDIDIETSTKNLNNFDCDEELKDLNNCVFEVIANCPHSLVAAIQCYSSFEANLVDGKIPNVGRVQVMFDDALSDVCYTREGSNDWIFYNTQVLCRELGYPGAMFDQKIKVEHEIGRSTTSGYECRDDLREESLHDCNPFVPNLNKSCDGEVLAACAVPGYVGCFNISDQTTTLRKTSVNMTINLCRHYCRNEIYRYALLSGGNTCFCASYISGDPIGDTQCRLKCSGDNNEVCGDNGISSAYDVTKGICNDPLGIYPGTVYFFGEIFTLQCDAGTIPVNISSVQCGLDNDSQNVTWNSTEFPKCEEINSTNLQNECSCIDQGHLNESDYSRDVEMKIIIALISVLLASWIVFIIAVCWFKSINKGTSWKWRKGQVYVKVPKMSIVDKDREDSSSRKKRNDETDGNRPGKENNGKNTIQSETTMRNNEEANNKKKSKLPSRRESVDALYDSGTVGRNRKIFESRVVMME